MRSDKINLDERFTAYELARMFNVECKQGSTGEIKIPLLKIKRRKLSRGESKAVQPDDFIREGITSAPAGSKERIEALKAYYADVTAETESNTLSAFTI